MTVGVGVHRLSPTHEAPYTLREIGILELLGPSLTQTIRSLALAEELNRYRSFADNLADIDSPIALLRNDWQIPYRNRAFAGLLPELMAFFNRFMCRHMRFAYFSRILSTQVWSFEIEIPAQRRRSAIRVIRWKAPGKDSDKTKSCSMNFQRPMR
ncbi:MAG: hypothetical protein ACU836_08280 [Gammaproteobacteria bacterium]